MSFEALATLGPGVGPGTEFVAADTTRARDIGDLVRLELGMLMRLLLRHILAFGDDEWGRREVGKELLRQRRGDRVLEHGWQWYGDLSWVSESVDEEADTGEAGVREHGDLVYEVLSVQGSGVGLDGLLLLHREIREQRSDSVEGCRHLVCGSRVFDFWGCKIELPNILSILY